MCGDGDVAGALMVTEKKHNIDLFLGIGGGPEGVLAASALDAFNCNFQGRFLFKTDNDIKRAKYMGVKNLNKKEKINKIPLIVIPTISGSGAESSKGSILKKTNNKKIAYRSEHLIPDHVFLDLSLGLHLQMWICRAAPRLMTLVFHYL